MASQRHLWMSPLFDITTIAPTIVMTPTPVTATPMPTGKYFHVNVLVLNGIIISRLGCKKIVILTEIALRCLHNLHSTFTFHLMQFWSFIVRGKWLETNWLLVDAHLINLQSYHASLSNNHKQNVRPAMAWRNFMCIPSCKDLALNLGSSPAPVSDHLINIEACGANSVLQSRHIICRYWHWRFYIDCLLLCRVILFGTSY